MARSILARAVASLTTVAVCAALHITGAPQARAIPGVTTPYEAGASVNIGFAKVAREAQIQALIAERAPGRGLTPYARANVARTFFTLYGWSNPSGRTYLKKVLAAQHPDGGWGLDTGTFDMFGDGSKNSADTTYTVTTADHVGPLILMGYQKGLVPRTVIVNAINSLMTTSTASMGPGLKCIAYSRSSNDTITPTNGRCVNNVNASAGWFLNEAASLGITVPGSETRARELLDYDGVQRDPNLKMWRYGDQPQQLTKWSDMDHSALNAVAHYESTGVERDGTSRQVFGQQSVLAIYETPLTDDWRDHIAKVRLGAYLPDRCTTTLEHARDFLRLIPERENMATGTTSGIRFSQAAMYLSILATGSCAGR